MINWLIGLVLFLTAYTVVSMLVVKKKIKTASSRQIVALYMGLKTSKLILFMAIVFIYMFAVKIETKRFVLIAVAIYCIFLLIDTLFLTSTEKKLKKNV